MANRPLMYIERQKCILLEVFKCLNQISPRYLHDMFEIKVMPYNLRNESIVILPKYNFPYLTILIRYRLDSDFMFVNIEPYKSKKCVPY